MYESDDGTAWGYRPEGSDIIQFIRKDMTSYTGEPVESVEVEETTVDRYFMIRGGESVTSYAEPSETSTSAQLTIPGQVHVIKITSNGFARIESGVYVKLSDVELDATEELWNNAQRPDMDRNYNFADRGGSVTVWSHVMRDGTLVGRSFTFTEGILFDARMEEHGTFVRYVFRCRKLRSHPLLNAPAIENRIRSIPYYANLPYLRISDSRLLHHPNHPSPAFLRS